MLLYLNRGLIVEQALVDIVKKYFDNLRLDEIYKNFHISVTNDHPFAHLIIHQDSVNIADIFPSVVITTENDSKVPEMSNMAIQTSAVEIQESDLDAICKNERIKTYFDEKSGEQIPLIKKGEFVTEKIPGYCNVASEEVLKKLKEKLKTQSLYGISYINRKRDKISIEIWCENNQLKNEIFEQLRILISTSINQKLKEIYRAFDIAVIDNSIDCQRSSNFNFDFDVVLYGSHISFSVDYNIQQIVIDTSIQQIKEIILEVKSYGKNQC